MPIIANHCPQCARFLPECATQNQKCGMCLNDPPEFDRTYALFPYEPPLPTLITELKFKARLTHARFFADCFLHHIKSSWYVTESLPHIIIPVPLNPLRVRERGFNQAIEMARPIAKKIGISLDITGLKRSKATQAQSGLKAKERKINVLNAFKSETRYDGLIVALLDDVVTTGSTISACAKILKRNGANRVDVWTVAKN